MRKIRRVMAGLAALVMMTSAATDVFAARYSGFQAVNDGSSQSEITEVGDSHVTFRQGDSGDAYVCEREVRIAWSDIADRDTVAKIASVSFNVAYTIPDGVTPDFDDELYGSVEAELTDGDYDRLTSDSWWFYPEDIVIPDEGDPDDPIDDEAGDPGRWPSYVDEDMHVSFTGGAPKYDSFLSFRDESGISMVDPDITMTISDIKIYDKDGNELEQVTDQDEAAGWEPQFYMEGDELFWKNAVDIVAPDLTQDKYCPGSGYTVWATYEGSEIWTELGTVEADIIGGELQDAHIDLPLALAAAAKQGMEVYGDLQIHVGFFTEDDIIYSTYETERYDYFFDGGEQSDIPAPENVSIFDDHVEWTNVEGARGYIIRLVEQGDEKWVFTGADDDTGYTWDRDILCAQVYTVDENYDIGEPAVEYADTVKDAWPAGYHWDSEHKNLLWDNPILPYPRNICGKYAAKAQLEALLGDRTMHRIAIAYNIALTDEYGNIAGFSDGCLNDVMLEILKAQMSRTADLTGTHSYRMGYYSTMLGDICGDGEPYVSSADYIDIDFAGGGVSDIAAPKGVSADYTAEDEMAVIYWDDVADAVGYIIYSEYSDGSYRWDAAGDSAVMIDDAPSEPEKIIVWSVDEDYNYSANMAPVSDESLCIPEGVTYYRNDEGKLYNLVYPDGDQMDIGRFVEDDITGEHCYGEPVWTWADDYSSASMKLVCTECDAEAEYEASVTEQILEDEDCENDGSKLIVAEVTIGDVEYTDSKQVTISRTGHDYGKPEWLWKDDCSAATAVFTCSRCEDEKTVKATVNEKIDRAAQPGIEGSKTVTASVTFDGREYTETKTVVIPAIEVQSPKISRIEPGNGKMNIAWGAVRDASHYTIHFRSDYVERTIVRDATKTGALITGVANGTYDVWVTAEVNGTESTAQNKVRTTLKEYYVPCSTQASASGEITISWKAYSGASGYRVVCVDSSNNVRGTKTTNNLSFKWQGLKNGETYGFYVQPCINGVYPTFIRTDAKDSKYIVRTCPVNSPMITKLSLGNRKIWIYYEAVPRAKKYYIYKSVDNVETLIGQTTATKYLATGLTNGKAATFYVKALVDGKLTPLKRKATRTTRAGMKPALTVTSGQCVLKWSKYTDSKASATGYKVVFVDENYKTIAYRETSNLSFTWKDKRLVKGKRYGFYVVPYVNGEYIPFGLSHAEDKANVVMFTAK